MRLVNLWSLNNHREGDDEWVWDEFGTTLPMSSYLLAVVVSDFIQVNSTENDHVLFRGNYFVLRIQGLARPWYHVCYSISNKFTYLDSYLAQYINFKNSL